MLPQFWKSKFILSNIYLMLFFSISGKSQAIVDIKPQVSTERVLGIFKNGFASISEGQKNYYINRKGEKITIQNPNGILWGEQQIIDNYEQELQEQPDHLPRHVVIFEHQGHYGILNAKGEILLKADYDHIDIQYRQFWKLFKDNKQSLYLPDGNILPFFENIGYIDGEYFDVKQQGSWHIYSKSQNNIITKESYNGFDYCGGCDSRSPYVYAQKKGKWGIIDWQENVLIPFEFEHQHSHMRSDQWVTSFYQNGAPVIIHIPTQQVFSETEQHQLVSGMLISIRNGKYGVYNKEGNLSIPFEYDKIKAPNQNHYTGYYGDFLIVEKNRQQGLVRSDGTILIPPSYESIQVYDDYFVLKKGNNSSLFHAGSKEALLEVQHGDITHINDYFYSSGGEGLPIFSIKQKAFFGLYFAETGRYYEPGYYNISLSGREAFPHQRAIIADRQGVKTYFDLKGDQILPFDVQKIEIVDSRDSSLIAYQMHGKWGIFDIRQQQEIVPANYDQYFKLLGDSAPYLIRTSQDAFGSNAQYDLYDRSGHKLHDHPFSIVEAIDNRFYLLHSPKENSNYMILDIETQNLTPLPYPYVNLSRSPKLLLVSKNEREAKLYDFLRKKELPHNTFRIYTYNDLSIDQAEPHTKAWILQDFKYGLGTVESPDGLGLIDEQGQVVLKPQYARLKVLNPNYIMVSTSDKSTGILQTYVIDKKGQPVFPKGHYLDDILYYNMEIYDLNDKVILLKDTAYNTSFGLGDLLTGDILLPAIYSGLQPVPDYPYIILEKKEQDQYESSLKFGLASIDGKVIIEPRFDNIIYPRTGQFTNKNKGHTHDIFPLLVQDGETWKYIEADGHFLPIEGKRASAF